MLLKADKTNEAGSFPAGADLEAMGKYSDALVKPGVLLDGAGLQPSSKGAKVTVRLRKRRTSSPAIKRSR